MANPVSPELVDFLQHAGIRSDHPIVLYMTHIGLTSETAFVEFRPDSADLLAWCDKFKSEIKFGAHKIGPIEGDHLDALKASLVAAHKAINKSITPTTTSAPSTGLPTPPATTHKDTDDKIPKTLPPGVYNELVEQYNKVTIHGQRRAFPEKQLLGAEKIIARMWHEHNKSKCYTAVTLGELLQHRHFTATGNINSRINDKKHETILTIDSESKTLVEKNKADWDPHTHTSHGDGRLGSHQMGLDPHPHRGRDRHPELHPTLRTTGTTTRRQNPTSQRSMEHLLMATRHADAFRSHLQRSQR